MNGRRPIREPTRIRDLVFETADGFITAGANSDDEWKALAAALEHPEWITDPRFKTPAARERNAEARLELVADVLKTRTSAQWLGRLDAGQVPCAPILNRWEVLQHPQVKENQIVIETEHPHAGPMRQPRPAARFDRTPDAMCPARRRCLASIPARCWARSAWQQRKSTNYTRRERSASA